MNEETRPTCPTSEVIESEYFYAEAIIPADGDCVESIAGMLRLNNSMHNAGAFLVPLEWEEDGDVARIVVGGQARSVLCEEWWPDEDGRRPERGVTVGSVGDYLAKMFGEVFEVHSLRLCQSNRDDIAIMDAIRSASTGRRYDSYPSAADLAAAGRTSKPGSGLACICSAVSPYFRVSLVTRTTAEKLDCESYALATRAFIKAANVSVLPEKVTRLESGQWRLQFAGSCVPSGRFFREPPKPTTDVAEALAFYLDSSVEEFRTFATTVSTPDDIAKVEEIGRKMDSAGFPDAGDFEDAVRAGRDGAGESALAELTGDEELARLIGLGDVKRQVTEFLDYAAACKRRGVALPSLHLWMTGNPGTGKTTLARVIGHMMHDRGLIPKRDVFVECDRESLVGRYIGHTAPRTKAQIQSARHGVLFIDEAYALDGGSERDFGHEALATIVKAMEDGRAVDGADGFVCIMAGYPDLMERMVSLNPGLRDRFGFKLEFPDYTAEELVQIFCQYAEAEELRVDDGARDALTRGFSAIAAAKDADFGNARLARKLFERVKMRQATLHGDSPLLQADAITSALSDPDLASLSAKTIRCGF